MPSIEPTREQIEAFLSAPIEGPVLMLNLLAFRAEGGRESYQRYAELVLPLIARVGARVVQSASAKATLIGEERWDHMLLVEYPSREAFLQMVGAPEYPEIAKHRTAALTDSRLICTTPSTTFD